MANSAIVGDRMAWPRRAGATCVATMQTIFKRPILSGTRKERRNFLQEQDYYIQPNPKC